MSVTYIIAGLTVIPSLIAFSNHKLIDKLIFWPYSIWRNNEWYRLITCSFIHADLGHLFFNMFALISFGNYVEASFASLFGAKGALIYGLMYFLAVGTADLYNLFKRKDDYNYRSLGASGGVSAVVFAFILLQPFGGIYLFFIPIPIPAFVFGGLYLFYCAYMAKRGTDNIGHIAHFTGSIFGFIFPLFFEPALFTDFVSQLTGRL